MTVAAFLGWPLLGHAQAPTLSPSSPSATSTSAAADSTLEIRPVANSQQVTLNFVNADIHSVVGAIGALTSRNI
ncbi:MAG: hypothetical protein ACK5OT_02500, partial [Burkholderiales bacterium]